MDLSFDMLYRYFDIDLNFDEHLNYRGMISHLHRYCDSARTKGTSQLLEITVFRVL